MVASALAWSRFKGAVVVLSGLIGVSPGTATAAPKQRERELRFRADEVAFTAGKDELVLHGNVVVSIDRYRFTSDHVRVERTPRGLVVDGAGRVALCPCPYPPVSVGFQSALVAPPTDLLLAQPTLRVGSVPVAWLPYLWLRSPTRLGLLPPKVAWRGGDGLFLGSGIHVPFSGTEQVSVDVAAGGYVKGGVDLQTTLRTRRTTTELRWDHFREDLLAADLRGSAEGDGGAVAWDGSVIRGKRGISGPILLEQAAQRYDRVRLSAARATGVALLGVGLTGDAARGGPLDTFGVVGPGAIVGIDTALGSVGSVDAVGRVATVAQKDRTAVSLVSHDGALHIAARPGPFGVDSTIHTRAAAAFSDAESTSGAASGIVSSIDLPLVRRFGSDSGVEHRVRPFLDGALVLSRAPEGVSLPWLFPDGAGMSGSIGAETTLGSFARRAAATLSARAGYVGEVERPEPAVSVRAVGDASLFGLSADAGKILEQTGGAVVASNVRLGRLDSVHVAFSGEARTEEPASRLRMLREGGWEEPVSEWLDRAGISLGGSIGVPWANWLASGADVAFDYTTRTLLGLRGSTAYRHPCGCLAVVGWAGHRIGRSGFDASISIDLMP